MRISDWSSDVCSSDLACAGAATARPRCGAADWRKGEGDAVHAGDAHPYHTKAVVPGLVPGTQCPNRPVGGWKKRKRRWETSRANATGSREQVPGRQRRSEENTSEIPSITRIQYTVFCC